MRGNFIGILVLLSCVFGLNAYALTGREAADKVLPSLVVVISQDTNGNDSTQGSGFFVTPDSIVTNLHVIRSAAAAYIRLPREKTKKHNVVGVLAIDKTHDLALLKVSYNGKPLSIGDSNKAAVGDDVYAAGNPMGLDATFSTGIVSSIRDVEGEKLLQITAPISHGSSGGPILNKDGLIIGVAVSFLGEGQNLNFAVPSIYLNDLIHAIKPAVPLSALSAKAQSITLSNTPQAESYNLPLPPTDWKTLKLKCKSGSSEVCYDLALKAMREKNNALAEIFSLAACKKQHGEGCYIAGLLAVAKGDSKTAQSLYLQACSNNVAWGCHNLGILFLQSKKSREAKKYAKLGCEKKDKMSCALLGRIYLEEKNEQQAGVYYQQACSLGYFDGCNLVGTNLERAGNTHDAEIFYRKACDGGLALGCSNFAAMAGRAGNATDEENFRNEACIKGDGSSCYLLGERSANDPNKSKLSAADRLEMTNLLFDLGCSFGQPLSCLRLAKSYKETKNLGAAIETLKLICNGTIVIGCIDLGLLEFEAKDYASANRYFGIACKKGLISGCTNQGKLELQKGNPREALQIFDRACKKTDVSACLGATKVAFDLGRSAAGRSYFDTAKKLLNNQCNAGENESCQMLIQLNKKNEGN